MDYSWQFSWSHLSLTHTYCSYNRAVRYHLKFAYHDTIVRVSWYTLGVDTSNVHMINDLHKTARIPFYVKMQIYYRSTWFKMMGTTVTEEACSPYETLSTFMERYHLNLADYVVSQGGENIKRF